MSSVEQVTDPVAYHGEGPVWSTSSGGLRFVDMLAGDVLSLETSTGRVHRHHVSSVVAAIRPRRSGGVVLAVERGFAFADNDLSQLRTLPPLWSDPGVRMNEGGCDPDGRFYCGSMAYDENPGAGALYRLDPDGRVEVVLRGVTISNGLAWSPDGATAYYVDSSTQSIDAFDYSLRTGLVNRRQLVRIPEVAGAPDGLTVDSTGQLWVGMWGGWAVHHYSPTGQLLDILELPVAQVTACTFGGPALDQLYITTSRQGLDKAALREQPSAGALFRADIGRTGLPPLAFGG